MVLNGDRVEFTGILAQFTANTTDLAVIADQKAFFRGAAKQPHRQGLRLKTQYFFRTGFHTRPAALAFFRVNFSDFRIFINVDRIEFTGSDTRA